MIVTLTLNPSVDRALAVPALHRGEVVRAASSRVDPGGKGINVSRALAAHGIATRAVVVLGGPEGAHLAHLLDAAGLDVVPVPIAGSIRSNVTVAEPDGTTTKLNEPGPALTPGETERVVHATVRACRGARWLVVSGSLPPGVAPTVYARLAEAVAPVRLAVDTSGTALPGALQARPGLVKPNLEELSEHHGGPLPTLGDAVAACGVLRQRGAGVVLASLGPAGALLLDADGVTHAHAPAGVVRSSAGAGDALLAGFLSVPEGGPPALAEAVAWGAAAVTLPGSRMPAPSDLRRDAVTVQHRPDPGRPLPVQAATALA